MKRNNITAASLSGTFLLGGDLRINRLGFGAMRQTGLGIWGEPKDRKVALKVLRRALELEINFIDTADSYGPDVSENLIAEALYPYPSHLVIATKGGMTRQGPNRWTPLGRPEYLIQCVEMSLRRLKIERIDLYQLHAIDRLVPLEDSLGALKEMQSQGKIRHIGLSNVTIPEIRRAINITPIVSVQNLYNLMNRKSEDVLHYCEAHNIGFIPWFPVGSGKLAQKNGELHKWAQQKGATPAQIALSWLLNHSLNMLPIPGTSSLGHLEENVDAASIKLTEQEKKEIESIAE